jgi:hypothetical protein
MPPNERNKRIIIRELKHFCISMDYFYSIAPCVCLQNKKTVSNTIVPRVFKDKKPVSNTIVPRVF